ncbi:MAG TPA: FAD binding domain-containing protein [Luteitalea sp.]|nr:FAD binding domain-containing protein [Luteitalea sp.]
MFELTVNGRPAQVSAAPGETLLDCLRAQGLTGAKEGCAEGECGACAIVVREPDGAGSAYRAINSCLMLAPMAAGREVWTVEGLARNGVPSAVQHAMAASGASQCGYCTPGFVMSLWAEYYRTDRHGPCDVHALTGNLCRCTGYRPIAEAARSLGAPADDDPFRVALKTAPPSLTRVESATFSRPTSIAGCLALLAAHPEATLVAGGTDVSVESNLKGRRWPHLVSLDAIDELRTFDVDATAVRIGAALSLAELGRRWTSAPAVIHEWLDRFASPLIRNRATLGGNLATASPIGDAAPLLLALDARLEIASPHVASGRRIVPLAEFFTGYRATSLQHDELIAAVVVPLPVPASLRFYKVAKRRLDDISTVAAAFAIDEVDGRVSTARFAYGGVAATPVRVATAEAAAFGRPWDGEAVVRVQQALAGALQPLSDHRGSAEYRRQVSCDLIEQFATECRP